MFKLWQKIIFSCYFIDSFSEIRHMKSKNCYYFANLNCILSKGEDNTYRNVFLRF